jgi:hypothetical protein
MSAPKPEDAPVISQSSDAIVCEHKAKEGPSDSWPDLKIVEVFISERSPNDESVMSRAEDKVGTMKLVKFGRQQVENPMYRPTCGA